MACIHDDDNVKGFLEIANLLVDLGANLETPNNVTFKIWKGEVWTRENVGEGGVGIRNPRDRRLSNKLPLYCSVSILLYRSS